MKIPLKTKKMAEQTEHYYSKKQTSVFKPKKIVLRVAGIEIELFTAGGVFSPKKLDNGSKLLIENAVVEKGWKVLDLGCGYGAVGLVLKRLEPDLEVVFSDSNARAVKLTGMNMRIHKMNGVAMISDGFGNKRLDRMRFDTILLNPPQTAGKDVCFRLITDSKAHLNPGGSLQLVARHQKGGKALSKKMEDVFGNVEETAKGSGFRIYVSKITEDV